MSYIAQLLSQSLGMEEMEQELQPVEGELEESVLEVVEAQGALNDQDEAATRLETTASALEAFAIALESRVVASRPLVAGEAHAMRIGLEALLVPCGFSDKQISIGLEEFGEAPVPTEKDEEALQGETYIVGNPPADAPVLSETEALAASQEALDGIKTKLKQFWEAIKAAVVKVWEMIRNFFGKMLSSLTLLKSRAASLTKKVSAVKGSQGDATITIPAGVSISGKASAADVAKLTDSLASTVGKTAIAVTSTSSAYYDAVKAALVKVEKKEDVDTAKVEATAEGTGISIKLPGGKLVTNSTTTAIEVTEGDKVEANEKATPLTKEEASEVAAGIKALCIRIEAANKTTIAVAGHHKAVMAEAEKLATEAGKGFAGKLIDTAKARWVVKLTQRNFNIPMAKVISIAIRSAYAALTVAEKSVALYKEAPATK